MMIYLQMGKTFKVKTLPGDFKVTTLENPLLSQQAVTNKGGIIKDCPLSMTTRVNGSYSKD